MLDVTSLQTVHRTLSPVRYEGAARRGEDIGGPEDCQERVSPEPLAEEESLQHHETRIAKNTKQKIGSRAKTLTKPHTPSTEWARHVVSHPIPRLVPAMQCRGERAVTKSLSTGTVFALLVQRKGASDPRAVEKLAEWVDALGSTQGTTRRRTSGDVGSRGKARCKKDRSPNHS